MIANSAAISTLLGRSPEWWDAGMLSSLAVAALAAFTVLAFTAGSVVANKRAARASEAELARYRLETEGKVADAHRAGVTAGESASTAVAEAKKAQLALEEQRVRAAQLGKDAAEARLEQERLKALVSWREVSPALAKSLAVALTRDPHGVMVEYDASDTEAKALAIQLANVLNGAKWRIGMSAATNAGAMSFGLFIPNGPEPATGALRAAFRAAGIAFSVENPPPPGMSLGGGGDDSFARLVVGNKPPPLQATPQ